MRPAIAWIATALAFCAMDFLWLSNTRAWLYQPAIGALLGDSLRIGPAVAFYVLYLTGLNWFAVWPAVKAGDWSKALLNGVLFGLFAYGTYDLTNQATLKVWSTTVTLADLGWGMFVSGVAATVACVVTRTVAKR